MEVGWEREVREKESEVGGGRERFLCDAVPGQALELYRKQGRRKES